MSNSVSFWGGLGKDAEVRPAGKSFVLKFSVGNNVGYGEKKTTNWFNCERWYNDQSQADKMASMLIKGQKVFIEGELNARSYESSGKTGTSLDVRVNVIDLISSGVGASAGAGKVAAVSDEDTPF